MDETLTESAFYVVDASVVVKCISEENQTREALALLVLADEGRVMLTAPELIELEVINVVGRDVRRGRIATGDARKAIELFRTFRIEQVPHRPLLDQAFELGMAHQQAIYDCLYLALALQLGYSLITADRRFHDGVRRAFPMVRMLGSPIPGS